MERFYPPVLCEELQPAVAADGSIQIIGTGEDTLVTAEKTIADLGGKFIGNLPLVFDGEITDAPSGIDGPGCYRIRRAGVDATGAGAAGIGPGRL